jgi:uncharacterized protein YbjT (DUF2867 family)
MIPRKSVLLAGATGLVGGECLAALLAESSFDPVTILVRRPLASPPPSERLVVRLVDFENLDREASAFAVHHVFCCLGTTMRNAGSRDAFRRVDYDYALHTAQLGLAGGAKHFLLVSALGADPSSRIFYNRVKGELEQAVGRLGYTSVTLVRPSLLLGERHERRLGEDFAKRFSALAPAPWRPVPAKQVAAALVRAAREDAPGVRVITNRELFF